MSKHRLFKLFKKCHKGSSLSSATLDEANDSPSVIKQEFALADSLFSNGELAAQSMLLDEQEVLPHDLNPVSIQSEMIQPAVPESLPSTLVTVNPMEQEFYSDMNDAFYSDMDDEFDSDVELSEPFESLIQPFEHGPVATQESFIVVPNETQTHSSIEPPSAIECLPVQTPEVLSPVLPAVFGTPVSNPVFSSEPIFAPTPAFETASTTPVISDAAKTSSVESNSSVASPSTSNHKPLTPPQRGPLRTAVDQIPIIEVARLYGFDLAEVNTNKYTMHCPNPEHPQTSSKKLEIDLRKNIAGCWKCGTVYRDAAAFLAGIRGERKQQNATLELAHRFKLISEETYQSALINGTRVQPHQISKELTFKPFEPMPITKSTLNPINMDRIFRCLMLTYSVSGSHQSKEYSFLSQEDFDYLHLSRKMSMESIKKGQFFTFPKPFQFITFTTILLHNKIIESLDELDHVLKGVPGFYYDEKKSSWTFKRKNGIAIPIKNADGLIVGLQIRNSDFELQRLKESNPKEKPSRYGWFSSRYDVTDGRRYGTNSGTPIDVVKPDHIEKTVVFITEGHFKAQKIAETFNCIALSVQGVTTFHGIECEIQRLLDQGHVITHLYLAYDADASYKAKVFESSQDTMALLAEHFPYLSLHYVGWDVNLGKGIDDLIEAGHQDRLSKLPRQTFENLCLSFNEKLKQTDCANWKDEDYINFYNQNILCHFPDYQTA